MPAISGPGPRAVTTPTTTDAQPTTQPTSTPAADGQAGWVAKAGQQISRASDKLVTQVKGKAIEAVIDEASKEHGVGKDFSFGAFSGNVKLSEEIALPTSDVFKKLVSGDRLRSQSAAATPDSAWVKTTAGLGSSAGFPLGAGASVGFNGSVEVSSVMLQKAGSLKEAGGAVANQSKSIVYPIDAEGLQNLNAAPGSEWMFRGQAGANAGISVGAGAKWGNDAANVTASVGASASASAQALYTKNVKVLENGKVFVQVGRQTTESASASLGVQAGVNLNAAGEISERVGGGLIGKEAGKQVDKQLNRAEDAVRINGSVSASTTAQQKVLAQAVLDLNTQSGRAAYDEIMRSGPSDAADFINKNSLGVTFTDSAKRTTTGANLQFGSNNVLSTSTFRGTEQGTVVEGGQQTTQLSETTYGRSVSGFLPRLFVGEERNVTVRAGALTKDGVTQNAVAVSLAVKDPRMHGDEVTQLQRFARGMGAQLDGLPAAAKGDDNLGEGSYSVQVALTDAAVKKFETRSPEDMRLAFAAAQKEISGDASMPPWFDKPQAFSDYQRLYETANNPKTGTQDRAIVAQRYEREFPGRSLQADIDSARSLSELTTEVTNARGKPVAEWGPLLQALGRQSSGDMRASILALRRLSGAEITGLEAAVGGKSANVTAEATAPKTMSQVVGELMAPPN